jgi:LPS-assembly protein
LARTRDVEFQPTNFQFRGQGLKTIYRQKWDNSELTATVYSANLETFKKRREQVAATDTRFSTKLGTGWDLDMRLFRTSQDTFLRRYRYAADDRLDSYIVAEKITDNRYYRVKASDTQGLREIRHTR